MNRATPAMRELAGRLIALETRGAGFSEPTTPAAFLVCEKLRPPLATLAGKAGFHALLSRSLTLANAEGPWLRAAQLKANGSFERLDAGPAPMAPQTLAEGGEVLLAQLLGLLVAFIGENLTLQLVREVWPKLSLQNLHPGKGASYEKTK